VVTTLKAVTETITELCGDGHLPEPGTIIVGHNHATVMPELAGAPVSGLLVWAMHLEGNVAYHAEMIVKGDVNATSVTATGQIGGIDYTILATTHRTLLKLLDYPPLTKLTCTDLELRDLASDEAVLGNL
jgi:hypothetical protein